MTSGNKNSYSGKTLSATDTFRKGEVCAVGVSAATTCIRGQIVTFLHRALK